MILPMTMGRVRIRGWYAWEISVAVAVVGGFLLAACSGNSARNHYILAEKLWTDKNYPAAVAEFERVVSQDPNGRLGRQALYRAATTQMLFLSDYHGALKKFNDTILKEQALKEQSLKEQSLKEKEKDAAPQEQGSRTLASEREGGAPAKVADSANSKELSEDRLGWDARIQIGEILYSKLEEYDQAILHYQNLLKYRPHAKEAQEFLFRIAKSYFYLMQFDEALNYFNQVIAKDPKTLWAEKAAYEKALTVYTRGGHPSTLHSGNESYREAYHSYEKFVSDYPKSQLVADAQFGMASCLEELNQLEEASRAYAELKGIYPSPQVIDVKLRRIKERLAQKSGAR